MTLAGEGHPVWGEIAPELTPADFREPWMMHPDSLRLFSRVRRRSGVPFRIVGDGRSHELNAAVGGVRNSVHVEVPCRAIDIRLISSRERFKVLEAAYAEGVRRIGIYRPNWFQRKWWGKNAGSLHLDDHPDRPQEVAWVNK